jgi:nucleotide-binding universal stress UspA family protein
VGWDAEPLVRRLHGGAGFDLARVAEELDADLIVLGSRGLGGVKAVLGSTSDLVVHISTVPVLVVPQPAAGQDGDDLASGPVLVGYDGSEGSRRALADAASIFAGRRFVIATVDDGEADAARLDAPGLEGVGDADVVVLEKSGRGTRSVAEALSRCAEEHGASVVVVGSRGRSAAREILLGSTAMGVLHEAGRPVLVAPGRRFG